MHSDLVLEAHKIAGVFAFGDLARWYPDLFSRPEGFLIANDQPLAVREWLPAFAQWLNAPPPPQTSVEDALKTDGGADTVYYGTQMRGVSNAKAKRELNFQP